MTLETVVVQDPDLVSSELDDYTMLMSIEAGKFYSINPLGSQIWQLLERPTALRDVCASLQSEYDVTPEQCGAETVAFVNRLLGQGLVRVQG